MLTWAEWNLENLVREEETEARIGNLDPKVRFKGYELDSRLPVERQWLLRLLETAC